MLFGNGEIRAAMHKPLLNTETYHPAAKGLDVLGDSAILDILLKGQIAAVEAVGSALSDIAAGAALMVSAQRSGGRFIYAAAGSSGLACLCDIAELPGTFGLDVADLSIHMAGGVPRGPEMPGDTEDTVEEAALAEVQAGDVVIAVTASGSTPYTVAFARGAKARGAHVIAMANNAEAEIFAHAEVAIHVPTPPEVVAGSTRLGAGTTQKVVLNLMSTLMGVRLGHVYDGMMVNLIADNEKLRRRAAAIVVEAAGCDAETAEQAIHHAKGKVKPAILLAAGAPDLMAAEEILVGTGGDLRQALARVNTPAEAGHSLKTGR